MDAELAPAPTLSLDAARAVAEKIRARVRYDVMGRDAVIELVVRHEVLVKRLAKRGRSDDTPEVVSKRLRGYEEQTRVVTGYYQDRGIVFRIDGEGTPDEVTARIERAVAEASGGRLRRPN